MNASTKIPAHTLELAAKMKGLKFESVVKYLGYDEDANELSVEQLAITLKFGVTAFFTLNDETYHYTLDRVYNANNDKTTKRITKELKGAITELI